ncbi:helix-turn-helix domain-containing protein [Nonomuraea sp. NPDC049152]|uniref:GlxA family transcriptional regulator n=1 Tax=Nonomuraea sp. NPDC049152 TaxID=3154350 RepID=UPI0033FE3236
MSLVVFLLIPQVHLLDVAGPALVFSTADDLGYAHTLAYVAEASPVLSAQGLELQAQTAWPRLASDDLIIVPGRGDQAPPVSRETLRRLRGHHAAGGTVAGLYGGADDRAVTSTGVAGGIDLALHLLGVRHGPYAAGQVARALLSHVPRDGTATRVSPMLLRRSHMDEAVHRIQDLIESRFTEQLPLRLLAKAAGCSERTVTRLFRHATGITPLAYQTALRLERAEHLLRQGATTEVAAREAGFGDTRTLRRLRARAASPEENPTRRYT